MQKKPLALSIAACLGLAGCHVFQKSETWDQAVRVRAKEVARDPDPSNAYAAKLHSALAGRGVEHKVVVYQYRYTTRLREEAVGTRTAVIYRDDTNPRHPWWLKDDRLNTPFWLPNGSLDKQVSFYLRRKAEVIETKDFGSKGGSGKTSLAFAKAAPALRPVPQPRPRFFAAKLAPAKKVEAPIAKRTPKPLPPVAKGPEPRKAPRISKWDKKAEASDKKKPTVRPIVQEKKKPVPQRIVVEKKKPAPQPVVVEKKKPTAPPIVALTKKPEARPTIAEVKKPEVRPTVAEVKKPAAQPIVAETKKAPKPEIADAPIAKIKLPGTFFSPQRQEETLAPIASRSSGAPIRWTPPASLDPDEQSALTAPRDAHLEKLFRAKHGTEYNRFSPSDRRKMQQLQHGVASRD